MYERAQVPEEARRRGCWIPSRCSCSHCEPLDCRCGLKLGSSARVAGSLQAEAFLVSFLLFPFQSSVHFKCIGWMGQRLDVIVSTSYPAILPSHTGVLHPVSWLEMLSVLHAGSASVAGSISRFDFFFLLPCGVCK